MDHARLLRFDLEDPVHGQVPCAALVPAGFAAHRFAQGPLPACLLLYGGGGSRELLADLQPTIEAAWSSGRLEPCCLLTPEVGPFSFYLDDPARGYAWESFIVQRLVPHARELARGQGAMGTIDRPSRVAVVGMSMGGYGALKLAFKHPQLFAAVGAVSPMLEPYAAAGPNAVPARNRFFYPADVPQALLGAQRDAPLYLADHPVARARAHVAALLREQTAIYLDAAGEDELNAHDGAESLHRALWELDLAHEYQLRRDSGHAGPDLPERVCTALQWVLRHLQPSAAAPSPLHSAVAPLRATAALTDPSLQRRYGIL